MTVTDAATAQARERQWDVDGLRLTGLQWGAENARPVLALHGWMDHAESFRELAPRLAGCSVVALDLSGQGLSSHRAAHATYNIWDDLPQITGLLDQIGWSDCTLVGHSRGAIIASLLAAAQPERVRALVALDSLAPEPADPDDFVATLGAFIDQTRKQKARDPRMFETRDGYIERRRAQGNSRHVSEILAGRALEERANGYRLRADPRLFASSAVKLTQANVESVLRAIRCPVLNIWAADGIRSRRDHVEALARLAESLVPQYEAMDLPGDHHFHLDAGIAQAMADAILEFLDRHAK